MLIIPGVHLSLLPDMYWMIKVTMYFILVHLMVEDVTTEEVTVTEDTEILAIKENPLIPDGLKSL